MIDTLTGQYAIVSITILITASIMTYWWVVVKRCHASIIYAVVTLSLWGSFIWIAPEAYGRYLRISGEIGSEPLTVWWWTGRVYVFWIVSTLNMVLMLYRVLTSTMFRNGGTSSIVNHYKRNFSLCLLSIGRDVERVKTRAELLDKISTIEKGCETLRGEMGKGNHVTIFKEK